MSPPVTTTIDGKVARILLARPDKANALSPETIGALASALDKAETGDCRVVTIGGEGKNMCAGADVDWLLGTQDQDDEIFKPDALALANLLLKIRTIPIPVIAMAKGSCFGGGAGMCCAADICVADPGARFSFSEVRLGIIAATIGPHVLDAILRSAERIDCEEARRIGIVHEISQSGKLEESVQSIVGEILKNAPGAIAHSKRMALEARAKAITQEASDHSAELLTSLRNTPEAIEGLDAFVNKRNPDWQD